MKKTAILSLLLSLIISCSLPVLADTSSAAIDSLYNWQALVQTWSYSYNYLSGLGEDGIPYEGNAFGLHLRPAWQWGRLAGKFDFAIYQNPWDKNGWHWGVPMPGVTATVPNFIDNLEYYGQWWDLSYQAVTEVNFGHGLLINEYHPIKPYHGWILVANPFATSRFTLIFSQAVIDLSPFAQNDFASLQLLHFDQSLNTGGLKWQLGVTGVNESYQFFNQDQFPASGSEYDLALTNVMALTPFYELGSLNHFGKGEMLGMKGKLGLISYQAGQFRAERGFIPNYYGGRYEDLKWNTWAIKKNPELPSFDNIDQREGFIGRVWIEVSPLLKLGYLYLDDLNDDTTGINLTGKIERLKSEYGLYYYNTGSVYSYDWFLKGQVASLGYEYHYYWNWEHDYRNDFELSFKF